MIIAKRPRRYEAKWIRRPLVTFAHMRGSLKSPKQSSQLILSEGRVAKKNHCFHPRPWEICATRRLQPALTGSITGYLRLERSDVLPGSAGNGPRRHTQQPADGTRRSFAHGFEVKTGGKRGWHKIPKGEGGKRGWQDGNFVPHALRQLGGRTLSVAQIGAGRRHTQLIPRAAALGIPNVHSRVKECRSKAPARLHGVVRVHLGPSDRPVRFRG